MSETARTVLEVSEGRPEQQDQATTLGEAGCGRGPDPEGVEALFEIAADAVADERARGRGLDQKAASITALVGVTLSLNATLGRPLLNAQFGPIGDNAVRVGFLMAVIGLLAAALFAVFAVFFPQKYRGLGRKQLGAFTSPETQSLSKLEVHQRMLGSLKEIVDTDRPLNNRKARALKGAALFIGLGLLGVAAQGLTLVLRRFGL